MSAAQAMEGVSTRVSTLLVLTSVSVEVDIHCPAIGSPALVSWIVFFLQFKYAISTNVLYNSIFCLTLK